MIRFVWNYYVLPWLAFGLWALALWFLIVRPLLLLDRALQNYSAGLWP